MKLFRLVAIIVALFGSITTASAAIVRDLTADAASLAPTNLLNPFGGWSFHNRLDGSGGALIATANANWNSPDFGAGQQGWVANAGSHTGWARFTNSNNPNGYDLLQGDIVTHSPTSVMYTIQAADGSGIANISGSFFTIREIEGGNPDHVRTITWRLYKNDNIATPLTTGSYSTAVGNGLGRGNAMTFSLLNVPFELGDTFRLDLVTGSPHHDFSVVNMTLTLNPEIPEPSSITLLCIGAVGGLALMVRSRRRKMGVSCPEI